MAFSKSLGFKAALLGSCFFLLTFSFFSCEASSLNNKSDILTFQAMDTFMSIKSYGKNARKSNLLAKNEIEKLEKIISVTNPQSEVYKINNSDALSIPVSEETASIIDFSLKTAELTDGAFNPFLYPITKAWGFTTKEYKVPPATTLASLLPLTDYKAAKLSDGSLKLKAGMQLDFGGIGKGWAGDKALKALRESGIKSAILDLGGNIQLLGAKPDGSDWNIGLRNPFENETSPVISLKLSDCAVITSGGYERFFTGDDGKKYIHIFDSKTGLPVNNRLVSVTIIAKEGKTGDALSTALFVMGKEAAVDFWKKSDNFEMIIICEDKSILYTKPLSDKLSLLCDFSKVEIAEK